ncbi:Acidic_ribosomal protein P0 [Hexamita inflata]|uniref:Acidic ribosomal protein P0 n=1 Tax=Hexamita inflata TaxID=28002 RepID=A0AA86RU31_9EUKA|nr:Acidic ribosomal protein P0 [Hexamita inflata]
MTNLYVSPGFIRNMHFITCLILLLFLILNQLRGFVAGAVTVFKILFISQNQYLLFCMFCCQRKKWNTSLSQIVGLALGANIPILPAVPHVIVDTMKTILGFGVEATMIPDIKCIMDLLAKKSEFDLNYLPIKYNNNKPDFRNLKIINQKIEIFKIQFIEINNFTKNPQVAQCTKNSCGFSYNYIQCHI